MFSKSRKVMIERQLQQSVAVPSWIFLEWRKVHISTHGPKQFFMGELTKKNYDYKSMMIILAFANHVWSRCLRKTRPIKILLKIDMDKRLFISIPRHEEERKKEEENKRIEESFKNLQHEHKDLKKKHEKLVCWLVKR